MATAIESFADAAWRLEKAADETSRAADSLEAVSPQMCSEVVRLRQSLEETRRQAESAADALNGGVPAW